MQNPPNMNWPENPWEELDKLIAERISLANEIRQLANDWRPPNTEMWEDSSTNNWDDTWFFTPNHMEPPVPHYEENDPKLCYINWNITNNLSITSSEDKLKKPTMLPATAPAAAPTPPPASAPASAPATPPPTPPQKVRPNQRGPPKGVTKRDKQTATDPPKLAAESAKSKQEIISELFGKAIEREMRIRQKRKAQRKRRQARKAAMKKSKSESTSTDVEAGTTSTTNAARAKKSTRNS